jgi:hypothetical protein
VTDGIDGVYETARCLGIGMKQPSRHVFATKPKFCCGFKPTLIMVRCPTCGLPHEEYFGPVDRDERGAEVQLLRQELAAATAIVLARKQKDQAAHGTRAKAKPVRPGRR